MVPPVVRITTFAFVSFSTLRLPVSPS
jgi:hypothetical protein